MTKKLLTVENIRSGAVPSDAVAVGFLLGEIERLEKAKSAFAHDAAMYASRLPRVHEPLEPRPMTLGRLVLETARGAVKERTVTGKELDEIRASMARYFKGPLQFREPQTDSEGPMIYDAAGNQVAMLYWPCHPAEETAAAEQATYALGHAMASALVASRDASSSHDQGSLTEAGCSPAAQSCEWTATAGNPDDDSQRTGPADLVGALQDVVHTDPGPVRAGKASRSGSTTSIPCIYRDGCRKFPACMIEARCCGNDAAIPSTR